MPKLFTNGIRIHYVQVGQGPDLVLLHGLGGNLAIWFLHLVDELRGSLRLTAYDLRGHGRSDVPATGYTTLDMAKDLAGLLDGLKISKAHILGHSFGADISLHFALLYPDRVDRLVVLEPGIAALLKHRKSKQWVGWDYWVGKLAEFGIDVPEEKKYDIDYLLRQTLHIPIQFGPARGRPRNPEPLLKLLDSTTIIQDYEEVAGMTLERIRDIRHPTLVVYGDRSHFMVTYEYLKGALPRCKCVLVPGGEHYGPLEQPDVHAELIRSFLLSEDAMGLIEPGVGDEIAPARKEAGHG